MTEYQNFFSLSIVSVEVKCVEVDGAVYVHDDVPGGLDPVELRLIVLKDGVQDLHGLVDQGPGVLLGDRGGEHGEDLVEVNTPGLVQSTRVPHNDGGHWRSLEVTRYKCSHVCGSLGHILPEGASL